MKVLDLSFYKKIKPNVCKASIADIENRLCWFKAYQTIDQWPKTGWWCDSVR